MNTPLPPPFASTQSGQTIWIFYPSSDPNSKWIWSATSTNGTQWQGPNPLPPSITTDLAPTALGVNGTLYLAYHSSAGDDQLWSTTSPDNNGNSWTGPFPLPEIAKTSASPSLAFLPSTNTFYVIYLGLDGSTLWSSTSSNGQVWSPPVQLPPNVTTCASPAAVVWNNQLFVFYLSSNHDGTIWFTSLTANQGWTSPTQLPQNVKSSAVPAVIAWNNMLYVIYGSSAPDGTLWSTSFSDSTEWSIPYQLPTSATTIAAPTVAGLNNQLIVPYLSSNHDQTIWQVSSTNGGAWEPPFHLPPYITVGGENPIPLK